jgi:hypothetical protein
MLGMRGTGVTVLASAIRGIGPALVMVDMPAPSGEAPSTTQARRKLAIDARGQAPLADRRFITRLAVPARVPDRLASVEPRR